MSLIKASNLLDHETNYGINSTYVGTLFRECKDVIFLLNFTKRNKMWVNFHGNGFLKKINTESFRLFIAGWTNFFTTITFMIAVELFEEKNRRNNFSIFIAASINLQINIRPEWFQNDIFELEVIKGFMSLFIYRWKFVYFYFEDDFQKTKKKKLCLKVSISTWAVIWIFETSHARISMSSIFKLRMT